MNELTTRVLNAMLSFSCNSWEHGLVAQSLYEAGELDMMSNYAFTAVLNQSADGRLAMAYDDYSVSYPAASGEAVLRAFQHTKDPFFKDGLEKMLGFLMMYAPRTQDGVIFHKIRPENGFTAQQIWVNDCYMSPPFLAIMNEFTESTKQFAGYVNYLSDENTGLFYKSYDVGSNQYISKELWTEGNALALLGTARMISEAVSQNEIEVANDLSVAATDLIKNMTEFQNESGLFYHIIDKPNTFLDSAAAMLFATAIYRGVYEGWLDESHKGSADRVYTTAKGGIDKFGFIHSTAGSPNYQEEGCSPLAQSAFVMMQVWKDKAEM